jgi:hypothetical protein
MRLHSIRLLLTIIVSVCGLTALAQEETPKSIVAIVGDAERFNIGQGSFCEHRSEIVSPSGKQLRIPPGKETFFYIKSTLRAPIGTFTCEGDFSFVPAPSMLHVVRYIFSDDRCLMQVFQSEPGGTPKPMTFKREPPQSCLFK